MIDLCIQTQKKTEHLFLVNTTKALKKYFSKYKKPVTIAMENTGKYNWHLLNVLTVLNHHKVYVLNPMHLKKSFGLVRGKNDKIDSMRICDYIRKNHDQHDQWKPTSESLRNLRWLLSERTKRVKTWQKLKKQMKEYYWIEKVTFKELAIEQNKEQSVLLKTQIKEIEKKIEHLFKEDEVLNQKNKLVQSVPGVGKIVAWHIISRTEAFERIDTPRKFACYSGVDPFGNSSGIFKGKNRVSYFADKSMKTLLHLSAMTAIQLENDLAIYYKRKVGEGKNKMSALNAVRNKIIHRVFAVVKNQKMYQNNLVVS